MKNLKYLSPLDGLLGLEEQITPVKVTVIPFGLEASVSYEGGTAKGPEAIIEASHQVELFDEDLWQEPYKKFGIETIAPFPLKKKIPEALDQLEQITEKVLSEGKFPMIFGGEHSITAGSIRPFVKRFKEISILHFDAHADLRDGYQGHHYSHASAMCRCIDHPNVNLVSIGIRNISAGEIPILEKNKHRVHIYWGKDRNKWNIDEIVSKLKDNPVYISFDVDGFDSSLMQATGTPEPGGVFWQETMEIIKAACKKNKIVGADIVELAPIEGMHSYNFLTAKLAYKILSYAFVK